MTSRRHLLEGAAAAGCLVLAPGLALAQEAPQAGKQYLVVRPPISYPSRPILVHDFFAYTCPHCLTFAPIMAEFAKEIAGMPDVKYVPSPVSWNNDLDIFTSTYFSLEAMNRLDDLHMPFWDYVIREEHNNWTTVEAIAKDIENFMGRNGIKADDWNKMLKSFSIVSKTRQASRTWKHYGVDSTPSIGIAGRFVTAPHLVGTRQGAVEMTKELIEMIRAEK